MRFSCDVSDLMNGLAIVSRALPAKTTSPILEGILIKAVKDAVILVGSDERLTIMTQVPAIVESSGAGIAPGKLISEIVRRFTNGNMIVTMKNNFTFILRCEGSTTTLSGQDPDLYPELPPKNGENDVALPQDMLKLMIQKTEFAISADDMREVLTGGFLELKGGEASMVALDGFRLALMRGRTGDVTQRAEAIIPGRAVSDIGKLLSNSPEAMAYISFAGSRMHVKIGEVDVFALLLEGEYIKYRAIIPSEFKTRFIAPLEPLKSCIDRAALMAREGTNNILTFTLDGDVLYIDSNSEMGDVHEILDVKKEGEDMSISFNVKYMLDMARNMEGESATFSMNTPITPCVITQDENINDMEYLMLILPVRTKK